MQISYKKWVAVLAAVLVVAIGAVLIGRYVSRKHQVSQSPPLPPPLHIVKNKLDAKQTPDNIPADLPQETGAKVIQNYNGKTEDSRVFSKRTYETAKSLADNYSIFQKYFTSHGWQIISHLDLPATKSLTAAKNGAQLQINMTENSVTKVKTVNINAF